MSGAPEIIGVQMRDGFENSFSAELGSFTICVCNFDRRARFGWGFRIFLNGLSLAFEPGGYWDADAAAKEAESRLLEMKKAFDSLRKTATPT